MTVVATLTDNRVISKESMTEATPASSGQQAFTVTFNDLRSVEDVIDVQLSVGANTDATHHDVSITGNVVGVSVYVGAGTTLGGDIVAIGH